MKNQNRICIYQFIISVFLLLSTSCSKDNTGTSDLPMTGVPTVTTLNSDVGGGITTFGGYITSDGGSPITDKGICWNTSPHPTPENNRDVNGDHTGTNSFTGQIYNILPNTIYYVRAFATNSTGIGYGQEFEYKDVQVIIPSSMVTSIYQIDNYGTYGVSVPFEINGITAVQIHLRSVNTSTGSNLAVDHGLCYSTHTLPTTADSRWGEINNKLDDQYPVLRDLTPNTKYYIRAYMINNGVTTYSDEQSFTTDDGVLDVEGNAYHIVTIGTQVWMSENLRAIKYRDGSFLDDATSSTKTQWNNLTTGAYFLMKYNDYYNGGIATVDKREHGYLYNWYAVSDSRDIAPLGWHVAIDADWVKLISYLGGLEVAGGKLKQIGVRNWDPSSTYASNSSGFSGTGSGRRVDFTNFDYGDYMKVGVWWSSTAYDANNAYSLLLGNSSNEAYYSPSSKHAGFSVRCVKD